MEIKKNIINRLLDKYINWERMWYNPVNTFKTGDKVKLNWKYKYHMFYASSYDNNMKQVFTVDSIDMDNVVDMVNGEVFNIYWLTKA